MTGENDRCQQRKRMRKKNRNKERTKERNKETKDIKCALKQEFSPHILLETVCLDRSAQTSQVRINSPRIHLHTPPNPTCGR